MKATLKEIKNKAYPSDVFNDVIPGVRFMNTVYRKLSVYFTWLFLRIDFSANRVTILGIIVLFISCLLFLNGADYFLIASLLLLLSNVLDYSDGRVAKYTNTGSKYGAFLDGVSGVLLPSSSLISIGVGLYRTGGDLFTNVLVEEINIINVLIPDIFVFLGFMGAVSWLFRASIDFYYLICCCENREISEKLFLGNGLNKSIFKIGNLIGAFLVPLILIGSIFNTLSLVLIFYSFTSIFYTTLKTVRYILKGL
ncbi:CDP-alcohol phosphatidyltransferase family protein [Patescibacteria group bacterium]